MKKLIVFISFLFIGFQSIAQTPDDFVFTVDVTNNYLDLYIDPETVAIIDWGDGQQETVNDLGFEINVSHNYATNGVKTIFISGLLDTAGFKNTSLNITMSQWGFSQWKTMNNAFYNCKNLTINSADSPNLSLVTDLSYMFFGADNFNSDISSWDVSNVTNMRYMFRETSFNQSLNNWSVSNVTDMSFIFSLSPFNQPLDNWDVSNVTDMTDMFSSASSFNQPLNNWNVANVTNMQQMFAGALSFDQPLNNWNVSNVTNMRLMFSETPFNQPLDNWNVSNVSDLSRMFREASNFNQPLDNWDVSNVTNMSFMFQRAVSFNQTLDNWNVSNVQNMSGLFNSAGIFNQALSNWDVSNVTDMSKMFENAPLFNQPLDNWDVSNVTDMSNMFSKTDSFNQPLNNWNVSNVTDMSSMFREAIAFNQPLDNWDVAEVSTFQSMFAEATNFNQNISTWNFNPVSLNNDPQVANFLRLSSFGYLSGLDVDNYDRLLQKFVQLNLYNYSFSSELNYCDSFNRNILLQNGWSLLGDSLDVNCPDNGIDGFVLYDMNNNGCNSNDVILPNTGVNISNGLTTLVLYTDNNGNYSTTLSDDTYTIFPIINTNLFAATPATATFTAANQNTTTQDFCLTATTPTDDLEITILPLEEARPGFDTNYKLVYKNKGNTQLSGNIAFTYDDDFMDFVSANPAVSSSSVGNLNWSFSNLDPFETREIDFTINMNTPTDPSFPLNSNDILNFTASLTPSANDATPLDNVFDLDQTVVNSYDPNDKTCLQGETIEPSRVGEYVHYRIRFENEGTASAINVRIVDYIDTAVFDISTFTPLSSSHDYMAQITEGNKVEFIFDNINLPNTAPASQGYVLFKIKTVSSLVLGDTISNQAGIYFDFNFPIITNLETTTVAMPLSNSDVTAMTMSLYPNPAHDSVTMTSNVQFDSYTVYDLRGVLISSYIMHQSGYQDQIDVSSLASGIYMIQVNSEQGSITQRLIVD
ncbi:BspA family leucine-rich repeat surface protein [Nonlabens sp. MIC269]|uniref:BspA family leucine-rich repeat surface protein n=1 Tax=Nonlabens sp. MIC269 TaxID=1476901 RepID=UPI000761918A|nr:BspA family leucine-rich repeat surface protein [Nonlabens sp. MIC269]